MAGCAFMVCETPHRAPACLTYVSPSIAQLIGHSAEAVLHLGSTLSLSDAAGQAALNKAIADTEHADQVSFVYRLNHADGRWIWIRNGCTITRRGPDGMTAACVLTDVSHEYALQADLHQTQERLTELVNEAPGVLTQSKLTRDGKWQRLFFSNNVQRVTGYPAAHLLLPGVWDGLLDTASLAGRDAAQMLLPETWTSTLDAQGLAIRDAAIDQAQRTGHVDYDCWVRHAAGHRVRVRVTLRCVPVADGHWRIIGTGLDITALHLANEARAAAEGRLAALVNEAPNTLFEVTLKPDSTWEATYQSGNVPRLLGFTQAEIMAIGGWECLHDADGLQARHRSVKQAIQTGEGSYEAWLPHKDGRTIRTRTSWRAVPGDNGDWRFVGTTHDISALHDANQAQAAAEARVAALLHDAPGMLLQGEVLPDGRFHRTYVSENVARYTGYSVAQIGADDAWTNLMDPDGQAERQAAIAESQRNGEATYECWIRHADGRRLRFRAACHAKQIGPNHWRYTSHLMDITDLHAAIEARTAAEARLNLLVQDGPGVLFQDLLVKGGTRQLLYISPNVQSVTGHSQLGSTGKLPQAMSAVDAAGLQAWEAATQCACETGEAACEVSLLHADGHRMWLRANMKTRLTAGGDWLLTGYMVDISREHSLSDALESARRQLEDMVASGPGWLYRISIFPNNDWRLDYISDNVERLTGYTSAEVSAPGWLRSVLDPAFLPDIGQAMQKLLMRERTAVEYRLRTKGGNWIWINDTLSPNAHASADGSLQAVGYSSDITQIKEQTAQLQQTARLAVLGEMASGMAHELRQPLSAISFAAQNAELALNRSDLDNVTVRLSRIVQQTERASNIIEHLRQFARGAEPAAPPERISLASVVEGTLTLVGESLRLAGIEVEQALGAPAPAVLAQVMPLEQVLVNLLLNARDALAIHRPVQRRIRIAAEAGPRPGLVQLSVSDNGGGISPAILPLVFQPFVTTKLADKGTGLGLSICHGIIGRLGGEIAARNDADGAVFTITLPEASGQPA